MIHYLDNAATTRTLPEAAEIAQQVMCEQFGNPSSLHKMGIVAAQLLKESRETVAQAMGCTPAELFFTSGGTEGINTAIFGAAQKNRHIGKHIVTTAIEHAATIQACRRLESQGWEVTYVAPQADGHVPAQAVVDAMCDDTALVSVMLVSNEVGTVLPVAEIGAALKRRNPQALFHIDAVQGLFRVPLTPKKWNCDLMSVSGHKIGAPKGIGAFYKKREVHLQPYLVGGGQESGFRSGTEPMPQIAAFAQACRIRAAHMAEDVAHVAALKAYLIEQVEQRLPWAVWNGQGDVPHVVNLSLPGCKSEVMLRVLESKDVFVSAGSACSKGKESMVLRAMGLDKKRIDSALRISFAPFNTTQDIDALLDGLEAGAKMLRR